MHVWCIRLAAGLMLIAAKSAFGYTCTTILPNFWLEPKAMAIQRDLPVGSLIAEVDGNSNLTFGCSNTEPFLTFQEVGVKAKGTYVGNFDGKRVYKTNIDGVGYAIGAEPLNWCTGKRYWVDGSNEEDLDHIVFCKQMGPIPVRLSAKPLIRLYKTKSTTGSGTVSTGEIGAFVLRNNKISWHTPEIPLNFREFKVDALSCTLGSAAIAVNMGGVPIGAFKGPGTSPNSLRTKAFDIPLTCSKGASINLQLDGDAHNAAQGMLKLSTGPSGATGAAIQLLYDDKPVTLGQRFKWQTADSDGTYAIPLKARYVQTGNSITTGVANGSATFTLTYQ